MDVALDVKRLLKEISKVAVDIAKVHIKLGDQCVVARASAAVVTQERERLVNFIF